MTGELAAETAARLAAAGLTPDDPGIVQLRSWNEAVRGCRCHDVAVFGHAGTCPLLPPPGGRPGPRELR